jgi:hypothetical protein
MKPIEYKNFFNNENIFWIELSTTDKNKLISWSENNIQYEWSFYEYDNKTMLLLSSQEDMTFLLMKAKCNVLGEDDWKASL